MARGYDNPRFNQELVMDLQFHEGVGALTLDWSKSHMAPNTLTGAPTWSFLGNDLTYLAFDSTAPREYIITLAADSGVTNFTSGAFSGMVWYTPTAGGNRYVYCRGTATTGWVFYLNTSNRMSFGTRQAAANQFSSGDVLALNEWQLVGFSRRGAAASIYTNGRETTTTAATHANPDDANAQNFYIGCTDLVGAGWMDGYLWRPRIWSREIMAAEHLAIFELERGLFGV